MVADEPSARHGTQRDLAQNSERPGRNMFAQGATDDHDREPWSGYQRDLLRAVRRFG